MALSFRELQQQLRSEWGQEYDSNGRDFDLMMVPSLAMDAAQVALVKGAGHNHNHGQNGPYAHTIRPERQLNQESVTRKKTQIGQTRSARIQELGC
jgi:hypothetical protein